MKVVYTLPVRAGIKMPVGAAVSAIALGIAIVRWNIDDEQNLAEALLEFTGIPISYTKKGSIIQAPDNLQEQAYRIASYVANRLYTQTFVDALDPEAVLRESPTALPETRDEEEIFKTAPKRRWITVKLSQNVARAFDPEAYTNGFENSAAYGYFADAQRAASPFQKFELYYKVIECFFKETGSDLDAAISAFATAHDPTFSSSLIESLRDLRNRSVHPRARKGAITAQNVVHVKDVHRRLAQISWLTSLLLENSHTSHAKSSQS